MFLNSSQRTQGIMFFLRISMQRQKNGKKLRERIGLRRLKKEPGCSWIEIKGKVHIFVGGNNAHPLAKNIELLLKKMRKKGYSPNMRYALINANEMQKEVALCGHSEKLAMAFGILSLPLGKTIRVAKNLRVCGDLS